MAVQVKICGLTNLEDALCAAQAGADMLGFIFTSKSARFVTRAHVSSIIHGVREDCRSRGTGVPKFVGVFVDENANVIESTLDAVGLDYAQLHGSESLEVLRHFSRRVFKAVRPRPDEEIISATQIEAFASLGVDGGPSLLIDAYTPDAYGGTGQRADWTYASAVARRVDGLMLAGGLNPDNVAAAIKAVHPWGVDVSSGVEAQPGRKDHAKVRSFVTAVREQKA